MDRFRIASTGHTPTYLPAYLADHLGYFDDEGLIVTTSVPDPWTIALQELDRGEADAVLGGAWLPAILHDRVRNYRIFAQVAGRYPLALLSRTSVPADSFDWLIDKVVLVPSSGGAAAFMFFTGLLRDVGIDLSRITFLRDLSHEMYAELFASGLGDAIVTYMVNAHELIDAGHAELASSLAVSGGPMPNSVYYTTEMVLERDNNSAGRFARAMERAMVWVEREGTQNEAVRHVLAKEWPEAEQDQLQAIVAGFWDTGLWRGGVAVDRDALARWQRLLVEGSLLEAVVPHEALIDDGPVAFAQSDPTRGAPQ